MLVVKCGTEVLLNARGLLGQDIFDNIAAQVADAQNSGTPVAIVSSGAIKAGREYMEMLGKDANLVSKKYLAGIGSPSLLYRWELAFKKQNKAIAMLWITYANFSHSRERENLQRAILDCQQFGIVPVLNENDVISDEEVRQMEQGISENDKLAAMVAKLGRARSVLFLTRSGGVYNQDPSAHPNARMYSEIDLESALRMVQHNSGKSANGSGGIAAKLKSAADCYVAGRRAAIAAVTPDCIVRFANGEAVGTTLGTVSKFRD